jgi:23S rRNA (adenine2503-C2)-methyltransferase
VSVLPSASRYDLNQAEVRSLVGDPPYRARQVWSALYKHLSLEEGMTCLPKPLRQVLEAAPAFRFCLEEKERHPSPDGAIKFVFGTETGHLIESVLMEAGRDRLTVCLSTQAGCAMGCAFCATGQAGFARNLTVGEILEQFVHMARYVRRHKGGRISNVVFMGMGEPLANYPRLLEAISRLRHDFGIGARHITVSTVGLPSQIRNLAEEEPSVKLAVSLHTTDQAKRESIIPVARRFTLHDLYSALAYYVQRAHQPLSIEWTLIAGFNDSRQEAVSLAKWATKLRAKVNLIPLNPTAGFDGVAPTAEAIERFVAWLRAMSVLVTVRQTKGAEVSGACGQLGRVRPERPLNHALRLSAAGAARA